MGFRAPLRRAALAAAFLAALAPRAAAAPDEYSFERGSTDRPEVALTFDGGSDAGDTEAIPATPAERGARATFFLTGRYVTQHPDLARRIAEAGHEVGNHTWSHPHLTTWRSDRRQRTLSGVDRALLEGELARTAAAWERVAGTPMAPLWRAPFGEVNGEIAAWAGQAGWRHVGWTRDEAGGRHTLDSLDWVADRSSRLYLSSAAIVERILSFGDPGRGLNGGVVLMHLCTERVDDPGSARLGELLDALAARGYHLVTVGEMLSHDPGAPPAHETVALHALP